MLKLLRHLLGLALLLGLAGNGVAVAAPCIMMTQGQSAAMADMPGCDMVQFSSKSHESKGKASGCMAMAACTAVLAMKEPVASTANYHQASTTSFWPAAAILAGRDVAPEPEPPTFLG